MNQLKLIMGDGVECTRITPDGDEYGKLFLDDLWGGSFIWGTRMKYTYSADKENIICVCQANIHRDSNVLLIVDGDKNITVELDATMAKQIMRAFRKSAGI